MSSAAQLLQNTLSPLFSSPFYQNQAIRSTFSLLGGAFLTAKLLYALKVFFKPLLIREKNLLARYGKDSWIVITGAASGIGKSYCFQFAKRGFNIVLMDRDVENGQIVAQEISKQYPAVQTKFIQADFSKVYEEGYIEEIEKQTKELDISVVVNHVGISLVNEFIALSTKQVKDIVVINCMTQALLTRVFLPRLLARPQKSAIITTSSMSSVYARPHAQIYASTKIFNDYFARGLAVEYPNLDVLVMKPGYVSTPLNGNKKIDGETITADQMTESALKNLGNTVSTFGALKHRLNAFHVWLMPDGYRTRWYIARWNRYKKAFLQQSRELNKE